MTYLRRINYSGIAVIAAVLLVWQVAVGTKTVDFQYLPTPLQISGALRELIANGALGAKVAQTMSVTFISSLLAIAAGVLLGLLTGLVPLVGAWTSGTVNALRAIPTVVLMPVALLYWGPSVKAEVVVAAIAGMWPMLISTSGGVQHVHPRLFDVADNFRLSSAEKIRKIVLPAAAPEMLVGARLCVISCLVVAVIGEIIISSRGLGWAIYSAQNALQPDIMWAYAFVCALLGYLLNIALIRGVRLAMPGGQALSDRVGG